jgi:glycosyltransferase involved in cell wall biosynthesis
MNPKISIITAVLNDPTGMLKTIESIKNQTYSNLEYIVIDGGSKQENLEILKKHNNLIAHWISEPDKGISDAFNKGIKLSTGDYVCFLGAGDVFYDNQVLNTIFGNLTQAEINTYDIISGKIQRISLTGEPLWVAPKNIQNFTKNNLLFKLGLPHQGMFMHKRYFNRYGVFDIKLKYAMDYDLLLRSFHDFPKIKLVDKVIANWMEGGVGTGKILEIYQEYHQIKVRNKIAPVFLLKLIHHWNVLKYKVRLKIGF